MKKFKTKISEQNAQDLCAVISTLVMQESKDHYERIHMAALAEVHVLLQKKMIICDTAYKITLSPVQALALSFLYTMYLEVEGGQTNQFLNRMLQINNQILQQYNFT